jgi:hypothetical protein
VPSKKPKKVQKKLGVVQAHPMRDRILAALAAGDSPEVVAEWCDPPVSERALLNVKGQMGIAVPSHRKVPVADLLEDRRELSRRVCGDIDAGIRQQRRILAELKREAESEDRAVNTLEYARIAGLMLRGWELIARIGGVLGDNAANITFDQRDSQAQVLIAANMPTPPGVQDKVAVVKMKDGGR